jgi:hypothetical protein
MVQVLLHGPDVQHSDVVQLGDGSAMAAHTLGGGPATIANPYMAAYWLSVGGWRLVERHGGTPLSPAVTMRKDPSPSVCYAYPARTGTAEPPADEPT